MAAERAARLALEAGQPDLALLQTGDLLRYHPQRVPLGSSWRLLHAASLQLAGQPDAARKAVNAAAPTPAEEIDWQGRKILAANVTEQILNLSPIAPPRPAGDLPDKAKLTTLWQANLTDSPTYGLGKKAPPPHWLPMPVVLTKPHPLLVQWDRHCSAFEPLAGTLLWCYQPLSSRQATRAGVTGPTAPRRPAVSGRRVYIVTDIPQPQDEPGPLRAAQALACLDVATGKPYWVRAAADMMSRSQPAVLDGTPLADANHVYLAARVIRTGGYHEIQLLKVDAHDGAILRRAPLFGVARAEYTPNERIRPVQLGLQGGIIYAATSAGAAAAVSSDSLQPVWARSFKPNGPATREVDEVREPLVPACWADPPLVLDDLLVIPVDTRVHILDRWTGHSTGTLELDAPIQSLAASDEPTARIAAMAGGFLHIIDPLQGKIVHKLDTKARGSVGLCALTAGRFLVSLQDQLRIVQPNGDDQALPVDFVQPAIPVVTGENIYLGSNGYLTCLGDGEKPLARLRLATQPDAAASASPVPPGPAPAEPSHRPHPADMSASAPPAGPVAAGQAAAQAAAAVRLVELSLRMGKPDVAQDALSQALQHGAADARKVGPATVQQLFTTCLFFGRHYTRRPGKEHRQTAETLLKTAAQCAAHPDQTILCQVAMADLRIAQRRPAEAVAHLQAILSDDNLRTAPLPEELGNPAGTAGTYAQACIAELISHNSQEIYAQFDAAAKQILQAAEEKKDRPTLARLLTIYPNTMHLPAVHLTIGRLALEAGDAKAAIEPLRKAAAIAADGSQTQKQAALQLAQAYEQVGSTQAAAAWMQRLANFAPDMSFEYKGRTWTAQTYAAAITNRLPPPKTAVHQLHLPLKASRCQSVEDTVSLVTGTDDTCPEGIALAWSVGFLRAVDARQAEPVWQRPVPFKTEPTLLTADNARIVLHDRHRVAAVDPNTGSVLWTWSAGGPDPDAPEVDPESVPTIQDAAATHDAVLVFTADYKATCLEQATGRVRWQKSQEPTLAAGLAASQELAVYRGNQPNRVVYVVLDVRTGKRVSLWQPARNVPAEVVAILPAATVMLIGSNAIEGYDALSGTLQWQVYPRTRLRTAMRLQTDTTLYIVEGDRHIAKIDTLTGKQAWRGQLPGKAGSPVQLTAADDILWVAAERGCHVIHEPTGRVLQTIDLPKELEPGMQVRRAAATQAGLLCLVERRTDNPGAGRGQAPPVLVLFDHEDDKGSAAVVASLGQATGLVSGWQVGDRALFVAAGNRVISLSGQQEATP